MVNFTFEAIVLLISTIPYFISTALYFKHYRKSNDEIILLLMITWFIYGLWWLSNGIGMVLLSTKIYQLNKLLLIGAGYALIIAVDYMDKERIDAIKLSIFTLLIGFTVYFSMAAENVRIYILRNGDLSIGHFGPLRTLLSVMALFISTIYLYYALKIYINTPLEYKNYALLYVIGATFFGPVVFILFTSGISIIFAGSLSISSSIGVLLSAIAISKSPQLIYVLPFKAVQLNVVQRGSGLVLFTHVWADDLERIPDQLIASAIESISMFTQSVLSKGSIREIVLEKSNIHILQDTKLGLNYILFSDNISRVLRKNLHSFKNQFEKKFSDQITDDIKSVMETNLFDSAAEIIPKSFPYIPKY